MPLGVSGAGAHANASPASPPSPASKRARHRRGATGSQDAAAAVRSAVAEGFSALEGRQTPGGGWAWAALAAAEVKSPPSAPQLRAAGNTPSPLIAASPDLRAYHDPNEDVWWDVGQEEQFTDCEEEDAGSGAGSPCARADCCSPGGAPRLRLGPDSEGLGSEEVLPSGSDLLESDLCDEDEMEGTGGSGNFLDIPLPCLFPPGAAAPRFELYERLGQVGAGAACIGGCWETAR
jgi:hypothetical protein